MDELDIHMDWIYNQSKRVLCIMYGLNIQLLKRVVYGFNGF